MLDLLESFILASDFKPELSDFRNKRATLQQSLVGPDKVFAGTINFKPTALSLVVVPPLASAMNDTRKPDPADVAEVAFDIGRLVLLKLDESDRTDVPCFVWFVMFFVSILGRELFSWFKVSWFIFD